MGSRRESRAALNPLPAFFGDALDPTICGGDLAVQVCADDEEVAGAVLRKLSRHDGVTQRWAVQGFGRASSTRHSQRTPRNLMGFKDGTNNVAGDDPVAMRHSVWVGPRDNPRGCAAAATSSRAGSGCASTTGTRPRCTARSA